MADYLQRFDATPAAERWPLVRRWMSEEPRAFFASCAGTVRFSPLPR